MKDNRKVKDIKDSLGECYKLSSILKIFEILIMFLISSFPESIGESRKDWIPGHPPEADRNDTHRTFLNSHP